jgi:SAM-dependent methyltransferase
MSFVVAADAYDRFMGRYSMPLSRPFADFAGVEPPLRVLDVGCGPGALTAELVARLGPDSVTAVDPSEPFVEAARERHPTVRVERASAENLPFADDSFDAALAQLVVHFMSEPVAGLREMARVTRSGGTIAACVWDHAPGGRGPLVAYWEAAREIDSGLADESDLAGAREGHLAELLEAAGVHDVEDTALEARITHETFEEWWAPFTLGVGPAGAFAAALTDEQRAELRERCRSKLPEPPFEVAARAWAARGRAA